MGFIDFMRKNKSTAYDGNALLTELQQKTAGKTTLPELVDAFEQMCGLPLKDIDPEDDMILFETGTYGFFGPPQFTFSMVRQFPNEEDEFFQLHLAVHYAPSPMTEDLQRIVWSTDPLPGSIFDCIRSSDEFLALKDIPPENIEIFLDET